MNTPHTITAESLGINVASLPVLLDEAGINERLTPIGRTSLYTAATNGEIQTVLLGSGKKRGRRLFLTSSVVEWILRRAQGTKPPAIGSRKSAKQVAAD